MYKSDDHSNSQVRESIGYDLVQFFHPLKGKYPKTLLVSCQWTSTPAQCGCFHWFHYFFYVTEVIFFYIDSKLKKLSEDSLTKQPEEVFDVLEKLGEG